MTGSDNVCNVNKTKDLAPLQKGMSFPPSPSNDTHSFVVDADQHACPAHHTLKASTTHAQQTNGYAHVAGEAGQVGGRVQQQHAQQCAARHAEGQR